MREKLKIMRPTLNRFLVVALALGILAAVGLGTAGCVQQTGNAAPGESATATDQPSAEFPDFVYNSATSLAAYRLAPRLAGLLPSLPCYCNCGRASGHKNLKDCFFKEDGTFNDHASNCDVCQDEVMDVDKWQKEGKSIREIRAAIDEKYRDYGQPTDTPPVE
ncbi:MAG: PCYCGC domain-containing protein [Chloroflexi bacterium]|nr:PCYCGC domain-containing protein [Chloroflexota bacterium]